MLWEWYQFAPDKWLLEGDFPFELIPFQVTCYFSGVWGNGVVFLKPLRGLFFLPRNHPTDHWCCCTLKIPTGFTPPFCTRHGDFHDFEISYLFFQKSKVPFPKTSIAANIALENVVGKLFSLVKLKHVSYSVPLSFIFWVIRWKLTSPPVVHLNEILQIPARITSTITPWLQPCSFFSSTSGHLWGDLNPTHVLKVVRPTFQLFFSGMNHRRWKFWFFDFSMFPELRQVYIV